MSRSVAPDGIEPIRAWRVWLECPRRDGSLVLGSLTQAGGGTRWDIDAPLKATCPSLRHPAPTQGCTCGIYAHKTRAAAIQHAAGVATAVVGEVAIWGRIIEHQRGYRAQYAEPKAIWLPLIVAERQPPLATVTAALSRQAAFAHLNIPVEFYHPGTGHPFDLHELRRILVGQPKPQLLRRQLPTACWRFVRPALLLSAMLVAAVTAVAAFFLILIVGVFLPLIAGEAASRVVHNGRVSWLIGIATALTVIAAYQIAARRFGVFGKVDHL